MKHKTEDLFADENIDAALTCPQCDSSSIATRSELDAFIYGEGDKAVQLSAEVPIHRCAECGFEFLTHEAETAQHEAVCRHLGVMTPREIIAIRERYGMSRSEFARLTRLGESTLSRWERGILIQNAANDRYLHLLSYPGNLDRLREPRHLVGEMASNEAHSGLSQKFRAIVDLAQKQKEASVFQLFAAA
ncbi:hypothetical protein LCGC14_2606830 [marine sediment metagenome]|uniref:HTH cro/C1-type domain-containing protein n=1 Tax=marine sediment metagenome TaxID=412755 RepID=A0A0F9CZU4_9ZZZZ